MGIVFCYYNIQVYESGTDSDLYIELIIIINDPVRSFEYTNVVP